MLVYTSVCACGHDCAYMHVHAQCVQVCASMCVHVCASTRGSARVCECVYVRVFACACV